MAKAPCPSRRRWTVIVYFSADNNLAEDAVRNLNQLRRVGSSSEVQLLALCDLPAGGACAEALLLGQRNLPDVGATSYVPRATDANGMPRTPVAGKLGSEEGPG